MKNLILVLIAIFSLFTFNSCKNHVVNENSSKQLLSPEEFKASIAKESKYILLDIRTPEEISENGMIEGAINYDFYSENFDKAFDLDLETPIYLYCRSGGRSGEAAKMFTNNGFTKVYDLDGGYNAWLETYK